MLITLTFGILAVSGEMDVKDRRVEEMKREGREEEEEEDDDGDDEEEWRFRRSSDDGSLNT